MTSPDSADDAPHVTDEPGRDPVSGRPWGEETPGKRVAGYGLLAVLFALGALYLFVERPGTDLRARFALFGCPVASIVFSLRAARAIREYRSSS